MRRNKQKNSRLDDLLKKKNKPENTDLDAFDKEALEGFALLENDDESRTLKNDLDKQVYAELLGSEKHDSSKLYWLAAAALAGLIGFSIYFFNDSTQLKNTDLALDAPILKQDELKQKERDILPNPEKTIQVKELDSEKHQELGLKKHIPLVQTKEDASFSKNTKALQAPVTVPLESSNERTEQGNSTTEMAAMPLQNESQAKDEQVNEDLKSADKTVLSETEVISSKSKKQQKKASEERGASSSPAANAAPTQVLTNKAVACTFSGDEKKLRAELIKQLSEENLVYKFDALLYINSKSRVEKVEYLTQFELSDVQLEKIRKVLLRLKNMQVSQLKGGNGLCTYTLVFRP